MSVYCISASAHERHLSIVLIGDSVDRYLVSDYCRAHNASLCSTIHEYAGAHHATNCTSRASAPRPLSSLFQFSRRIFPWGVVICDDYDRRVSLGFLFNTQGVSPHPPWFWPAKAMLELENKILHNFTMARTFDVAQGPAVAPLIQALGGHADAVMINSAFWDIGRLVTGELGRAGGKETCSSPVKRAAFVSTWARNASQLIQAVDGHFSEARWRGWRTANRIVDPAPPCRNNLVTDINQASYEVAEAMNLTWLDFYSFPGVDRDMRDSHHPSASVTADFMLEVVKLIQKEI